MWVSDCYRYTYVNSYPCRQGNTFFDVFSPFIEVFAKWTDLNIPLENR